MVARHVDQHRLHQRVEGRARLPPGAGRGQQVAVVGQPPPGIEGRAERRHGHPAQQRLEPQPAGHRPDPVHPGQQGQRVGPVRDDIGQRAGVVRQGPGAQARLDIRVRLVDDPRVRVGRASRLQQRGVGADRPGPEADRGVVLHLSRHQQAQAAVPGRWWPRVGGEAGQVVLRQSQRHEPLAQVARAGQALGGPGRGAGDGDLDGRGARGVIVDAARIADQRQRRHEVGPQPARADQAVLDPVEGDARGPGGGAQGVGLLRGPDEQWRAPFRSRGDRAGGRVGKAQARSVEPAQRRALPQPHPGRGQPARVLAPGAGLGGQRGAGVLEPSQPVAGGVIPVRIEQHRPGEELGAGQDPAPAGDRLAVLRQAPAGVERLAENMGAVSGKDRLEPHLRGDGIDRDGTAEQVPGRHGRGQEGRPVVRVPGAEMAAAQPARGFGMRLHHDAGMGVVEPRLDQHLAERVAGGAAQPDRGIAARLVDDQHVARIGQGRVGRIRRVFGDLALDQIGDPGAGAGQEVAVVERVGAQQGFEVGGAAGVVVGRAAVDQQADGGGQRAAPGAPGQDRAQEGVFEPDQRRAAAVGHPGAPLGGPAAAPDRDGIARARPRRHRVEARQRQDPSQPTVAQVAERGEAQPLGHGGCPVHHGLTRLPVAEAVLSEPVIAVSDLSQVA